MYHEFVVFETSDSWWWSIEKNPEGLTIQRNRSKDAVVNKYRHVDRFTPITIRKNAVGNMKMEDLIDWLYIHDELNTDYDLLTSNCQHFAKRVFDRYNTVLK